MMRTRQLFPFLLLALSCTGFATGSPWVLEKDEDHIQLYTRSVAGSPFIAVKVTTTINAPIEKVASAFGDGNGCSQWRAMCKSSEVLSTVSDTERYVYLVLDLPWPLSDRDMVIHSVARVDPQSRTATVQLESASTMYPAGDYVRAESEGSYQITALSNEQVEFTYIMHADLGGDLSPDVINPRMASSTYEDVKRLRLLAEK
ncbi:MAG: START domain-containing protein [Halioglobus sp.]